MTLTDKAAHFAPTETQERAIDQWKSIGTAPKDGTLILVWAAPGQHDLPAMFSLSAWHPDAGFCICELRHPTHWMPLPDPPSAPALGHPPVAE